MIVFYWKFRRLVAGVVATILLAAGGCGGGPSYDVAEVDGVLLVNGKPAPKVRVEFHPDSEQGAEGPMSTADTDEEGEFTLQLMEGSDGSSQSGAVVGWHRVVLSDLQLAESATGKGVAKRLKDEYTLIGSTTLKQEVSDEPEQTVTLDISYP